MKPVETKQERIDRLLFIYEKALKDAKADILRMNPDAEIVTYPYLTFTINNQTKETDMEHIELYRD